MPESVEGPVWSRYLSMGMESNPRWERLESIEAWAIRAFLESPEGRSLAPTHSLSLPEGYAFRWLRWKVRIREVVCKLGWGPVAVPYPGVAAYYLLASEYSRRFGEDPEGTPPPESSREASFYPRIPSFNSRVDEAWISGETLPDPWGTYLDGPPDPDPIPPLVEEGGEPLQELFPESSGGTPDPKVLGLLNTLPGGSSLVPSHLLPFLTIEDLAQILEEGLEGGWLETLRKRRKNRPPTLENQFFNRVRSQTLVI